MLNTREKRFIRYWQEQRSGGKGPFFLLYTIGGTLIITLFCFVVLLFFLQVILHPYMLWLVPSLSLLAAYLLTWLGWRRNERQWKAIIRREVRESKEKEQG